MTSSSPSPFSTGRPYARKNGTAFWLCGIGFPRRGFIETKPCPPLALREIMTDGYQTARDKHFRGPNAEFKTFGDDIALITSELSEALEEFRDGRGMSEVYYGEKDDKPEGIAVEFADAVIRLCEGAYHYGIPLEQAIIEKMAFNCGRPVKHGREKL